MIDSNLLAEEKALAKADPFYLIKSEALKIKTKNSELVPLKLKSAQRIIMNKILELKEQKKPVRIWILKYRQGGVSTMIEALIFSIASQQANVNALIMADEKDKSTHLFEMSKLFQEELEKNSPHLVEPLKKSNEKKLEWERSRSQILITSSENPDAARAFTFQIATLSECSRFRDLKQVLGALLQSVPDHERTMIIGETTANGLGGAFYDEWIKAEQGRSDWVALFIPWFTDEDYKRPLEKDAGEFYRLDEVQYDTEGGNMDFLKEEQMLKEKFALTDAQLNWRRWAIVNKCQGSVATFREEYPADSKEAFLVTGRCVFDKIKLKQQKMASRPPLAIGELVELESKAVFRENNIGMIRVYEYPKKDAQYAIGADGSRTLTGDPSAAVVIDKYSNKTVAVLHGRIDPDQFAQKLRLLGVYYNQAIIAPETNDAGYATCDRLFKIYGNTYIKTSNDGKTIVRIGWRTDSVSRPQMIATLRQEIREGATELMDEPMIDECLSFIELDSGKLAAAPGCHDDLVIARMIAGMMRLERPFSQKKKKKGGYKDFNQPYSHWQA